MSRPSADDTSLFHHLSTPMPIAAPAESDAITEVSPNALVMTPLQNRTPSPPLIRPCRHSAGACRYTPSPSRLLPLISDSKDAFPEQCWPHLESVHSIPARTTGMSVSAAATASTAPQASPTVQAKKKVAQPSPPLVFDAAAAVAPGVEKAESNVSATSDSSTPSARGHQRAVSVNQLAHVWEERLQHISFEKPASAAPQFALTEVGPGHSRFDSIARFWPVHSHHWPAHRPHHLVAVIAVRHPARAALYKGESVCIQSDLGVPPSSSSSAGEAVATCTTEALDGLNDHLAPFETYAFHAPRGGVFGCLQHGLNPQLALEGRYGHGVYSTSSAARAIMYSDLFDNVNRYDSLDEMEKAAEVVRSKPRSQSAHNPKRRSPSPPVPGKESPFAGGDLNDSSLQVIFRCRVLLGRCKTLPGSSNAASLRTAPYSYHSVYTVSEAGEDEMVVYRDAQIIITDMLFFAQSPVLPRWQSLVSSPMLATSHVLPAGPLWRRRRAIVSDVAFAFCQRLRQQVRSSTDKRTNIMFEFTVRRFLSEHQCPCHFAEELAQQFGWVLPISVQGTLHQAIFSGLAECRLCDPPSSSSSSTPSQEQPRQHHHQHQPVVVVAAAAGSVGMGSAVYVTPGTPPSGRSASGARLTPTTKGILAQVSMSPVCKRLRLSVAPS